MADDGPVIGSVSVRVVPNADGFADRLKGGLDADAAKIGQQLGRILGDAILNGVQERTRDMDLGPTRDKSQRDGEQSAGSFADGFRRKLEAAARSLPKLEITANSSDADKKLAKLREELVTLAGKKVGVDITDTEAIIRLQDLQRRLDELNRTSDRLDVKADTTSALEQLDKLKAQLDEIGAKKEKVTVDVNDDGSIDRTKAKIDDLGSSGGNSAGVIGLFTGISGGAAQSTTHVVLLGEKIAAIAAIAGASAAAAIPALAAVGAAGVAAVAGIGVLGLGFGGIFSTLQAKGSQFGQNASSGSGSGGPSAQQKAIQQQLAALTAKQSTQSAADQLHQATQAQTAAEIALHDARKQALTDIVALDNAVVNNSLNERQAVINLDAAKKTLAIMLAAPGANLPQYAAQIAQARLTVDQGKEKLKELQQAGITLRAQDAASDKAGVAGSKIVVDAKQALADANHKLAEAQQNVIDTALKNKLLQEQAALSSANSFKNASLGVNAYQKALAQLNPVQRQFVLFIEGMKPAFDQIKAAASGFLPGLESGIKGAMPAFQPLLAVVGNIAKSMGNVFTAIGNGLGSASGQRFISFLAAELPKIIQFLGGAFISLGKTFAGLFQAAAPLINSMNTVLSALLGSLAKAAGGGGLKSFFDALIPVAPKLGAALASIAGIFGQLLDAALPLVGPLLDFITTLGREIGTILKPVIGALAIALGSIFKALSPIIPILGHLIATVLPPFAAVLAKVVVAIVPLLPPILQLITTLLPPLAQIITQVVDALQPLIPALAQGLTQGIKSIAPLIPQLVTAFSQFAQAIAQLVVDFAPLIPVITKLVVGGALSLLIAMLTGTTKVITILIDYSIRPVIGWIKSLGTEFGNLGGTVSGFSTTISGVVSGAFKTVTGLFKGFSTTISGIWDGIWKAISTVDKTWLGAITGTFKTVANVVIDAINFMIRAIDNISINLPKVHIPGFGDIGGHVGFNIPQITPLRDNGGPVAAGHPYMVGVNGLPELFVPSVAGSIMDNATLRKNNANGRDKGGRATTVYVYGATNSDAVAHAVGNRLLAAGV